MSRLSRSEKKELTTAQLLETARKVFLERGYHRSTLDDIADTAGFTKGAVYSRFRSKDELFFALYDAWVDQRIAEFATYANPAGSFEALLRGAGRRLMTLRNEHSDWYLLLLEFWTYAARDDRLREELAVHHGRFVAELAAAIELAARALGATLKRPAIYLARAGSAMALGVTLERLLDPQSVPETMLESMLVLLASEITPPTSDTKGSKQKHKTRPRTVAA